MPFTYQGSTIDQPGVIATQSSSGMASQTTSTRLVVLVGISGGGGQPKTIQYLGGQQDAITKLVSGQLQTAAARSYIDGKSPYIAYMRVNPAVQSSYAVQGSTGTVINLKSSDYGGYTNRITAQFQNGSTQGIKATVTLDSATYNQDNLYQAALSIQYTGADASALVTVSNTNGNITGSSGASGSETLKWTAPFSTYTTIQQLVNYINSQAGWVATILTTNPNSQTLNSLDDITSAQAKTSPATITATLQAVINWLNSTTIVTATRPANVGSLPTAMPAPAYLSGGNDGAPTNTDWAAAFTALQNVPGVRIIVPITGDPSIHAMASSHCAYMSDPTVRHNRISICGGVQGETPAQAVTRAANLNSRRVSLIYPGIQDIDPITNNLATYDPFVVAAQTAGLLSTMGITQAMTRKTITCKGLEGNLQSTLQKSDYDMLSTNGVMAIKYFQNDNGSYYGYVRSLTTWMQDTKLDNIELSMVCNEDYVSIAVGDAIDALIGSNGGPIGAGQAQSEADSTLRNLATQNVIVGDQNTPAYGNVVSYISGDQVITTYDATIPAPMNFAGVSAAFSAYSSLGSA